MAWKPIPLTIWRLPLLTTLMAVVLVSCARSGSPVSDAKALARQQAEQLYRQAWHMVLEEYVDPTFNGQDWYRWKDRYHDKLASEEDAYVAIETMLASLNDEYTRFLKPRDMREQTMNIDSRLFGVGIQISLHETKLVVMSTIEETPAAAAGLKPMDIITHINGEETVGMGVEDAADRIRGPEGTTVHLRIRRPVEEGKGTDQLFERDIKRAEIKIKSVFTRDLKNKSIGYIRLSSFISETTLPEMQEKLLSLKNKKAIILDIRGNYGGLLSNAVDVADMFLDEGDIVSIVDRKQSRRVYTAHPGQILDKKPLIVLIDGGSASASEILGGALKDHKRAVLIGENTFGKGLVQKINPMLDGSGMNITISKYLTPKGHDINKKGIAPNINVPFGEEDFLKQRDPQLEKAVEYAQSQLLMASGR